MSETVINWAFAFSETAPLLWNGLSDAEELCKAKLSQGGFWCPMDGNSGWLPLISSYTNVVIKKQQLKNHGKKVYDTDQQ